MVFEFTREWFMDKKNQVHTNQDNKFFGRTDDSEEIPIGGHFLLDLIPVENDVEIWEVENTVKKHMVKGRGKLDVRPIRKITTGKQFGYPNGYWKIPYECSALVEESEK
jgi:hypothetical protein